MAQTTLNCGVGECKDVAVGKCTVCNGLICGEHSIQLTLKRSGVNGIPDIGGVFNGKKIWISMDYCPQCNEGLGLLQGERDAEELFSLAVRSMIEMKQTRNTIQAMQADKKRLDFLELNKGDRSWKCSVGQFGFRLHRMNDGEGGFADVREAIDRGIQAWTQQTMAESLPPQMGDGTDEECFTL